MDRVENRIEFWLALRGREVQVGEEDLAGAQHRDLRAQRLLHLDDQLRAVEHGTGVRRDRRSLRRVVQVGEAARRPGARLDQHVVAALGQLPYPCGRHRDAVLVGFDLARNPDLHGSS